MISLREKKLVLGEKYFLIFSIILFALRQIRFNSLFCKFVFSLNCFHYLVDDTNTNKRLHEHSHDCGGGFGGGCSYHRGSQHRNVEV